MPRFALSPLVRRIGSANEISPLKHADRSKLSTHFTVPYLTLSLQHSGLQSFNLILSSMACSEGPLRSPPFPFGRIRLRPAR